MNKYLEIPLRLEREEPDRLADSGHAILQNLIAIIYTPQESCSFDFEFGANLHKWETGHTTSNQLGVIQRALEYQIYRYEPRLEQVKVTVKPIDEGSEGEHGLSITVQGTVKKTGKPFDSSKTLVYRPDWMH